MKDTYIAEREQIEKDPSLLTQLETRSREARERNLITIPLLGWKFSPPSYLAAPAASPSSLLPMLTALKAATESYLETEISHVEVVTAYTSPGFKEDNRAALAALDLKTSRVGGGNAAVLLWYVKTVDEDTHGCNVWFPAESYGSPAEQPLPKEDFVLSIEYTEAGFTGSILDYECEVASLRHDVHSSALGAAAVRTDPQAGREALENALRELIRKALPTAAKRKPHWHPLNPRFDEQLTHLLLMGEAADNAVLREALDSVLSQHLGREDSFGMLDERHGFGDALFTASSGAARYCLQDFIWSGHRSPM
jgi:hypothetical protein